MTRQEMLTPGAPYFFCSGLDSGRCGGADFDSDLAPGGVTAAMS